MAKKGGKKKTTAARGQASLSAANQVFGKVLDELRKDPSHPQWKLAMRGVMALKDLNEVFCALLSGGTGDGDGDFGQPFVSGRRSR